MASGVGIDLLEIRRLERALKRHPRLAARVFTEAELAYAAARARPGRHLAARFAAKEATIKVLRPRGHQPDWRSLEVRRHSGGWCTMALSGHAATLADEAGIADLAVSLTHEGDMAAAVVVALCRPVADLKEQSGMPLDVAHGDGSA